MDSSQVFGGAEECHSSESGWTMYIGSPVQNEEDVSDPNGNDADGEYDDLAEENDDENSDDSMVSDASSGPSHREQPRDIKKCNRPVAKVDGNHYSNYKTKKAVKKNRHENRKEEKDHEPEVAAKGANHLVQGSEVGKNLGWGKQIK